MPHDAPGEPTSEELKHILQESILRNYPNPERKGCPGSNVLKEVAQQRLPFETEHWEHISHCSPCYREFLDHRKAALKAKNSAKRRSRTMTAIIALFIVGAAVYWSTRNLPSEEPKPEAGALPSAQQPVEPSKEPPQPQIAAVLNLESESKTRNVPSPNAGPAVGELQRLPKGQLNLSIYLPLGSEAGLYEVRLLKTAGDSSPLATFSASATIDQGLTVLKIEPDLARYDSGTYTLAIRHGEESWRYYSFLLS